MKTNKQKWAERAAAGVTKEQLATETQAKAFSGEIETHLEQQHEKAEKRKRGGKPKTATATKVSDNTVA